MKIIVGTDPFALNLKTVITERLNELGHEVIYQDGESGNDYWVSARKACEKIQSGDAERPVASNRFSRQRCPERSMTRMFLPWAQCS
jgi:ribose 5-phosphate isomerase RpiB